MDKLLELINDFSKVARYRSKYKKILFLQREGT